MTSPHRQALEAAFGPLRAEPGWQPPDFDVLFLCFTNRSGSNYLANLLATTGAFNEAGEFFNASTVLEHAVPRGLRSLAAYFSVLPALVPRRRCLAAKVAEDQLVMLADAGILPALGARAHYLLLERQDRLGQAISRVIAMQNSRWTTAHRATVPDSALVFDRAQIDREIERIAGANAAFYLFFRANDIVPIHLSYEAVLADPNDVMATIGAAMGLSGLAARSGDVTIERQANEVNQAWRAAYRKAAVLF